MSACDAFVCSRQDDTFLMMTVFVSITLCLFWVFSQGPSFVHIYNPTGLCPSAYLQARTTRRKRNRLRREEEEEGGDSKADEVAHPHEHVSIITVLWFPGTARPPGDAAIGHICGVLRWRVVQHSCGGTHNQSDNESGGSSVCMHM